jgi:uncharacterized membrane protein
MPVVLIGNHSLPLLAIIIGVVLAFLIYKERWTLARILGVGLICAGLVLVGAFGG